MMEIKQTTYIAIFLIFVMFIAGIIGYDKGVNNCLYSLNNSCELCDSFNPEFIKYYYPKYHYFTINNETGFEIICGNESEGMRIWFMTNLNESTRKEAQINLAFLNENEKLNCSLIERRQEY